MGEDFHLLRTRRSDNRLTGVALARASSYDLIRWRNGPEAESRGYDGEHGVEGKWIWFGWTSARRDGVSLEDAIFEKRPILSPTFVDDELCDSRPRRRNLAWALSACAELICR